MAQPISETDKLYLAGKRHEVLGEYESAIEMMQRAVKLAPKNSSYHHLLGKSYGQLAQQSNWIKAIKLAKQSRIAFETAVELDPANLDAVSDLLKYYLQAPKFLGGSPKKAKALKKQYNLEDSDY